MSYDPRTWGKGDVIRGYKAVSVPYQVYSIIYGEDAVDKALRDPMIIPEEAITVAGGGTGQTVSTITGFVPRMPQAEGEDVAMVVIGVSAVVAGLFALKSFGEAFGDAIGKQVAAGMKPETEE